MNIESPDMPRILLVDDDEAVHAALLQILAPEQKFGFLKDGLEAIAGKLFDRPVGGGNAAKYDLVSCFDLAGGLAEIISSIEGDSRFSLILLDMKMVLAAESLGSVEKIRELDPVVNILLMTQGGDPGQARIPAVVKPADKLFYIEKPLAAREIVLLAHLLSTKWRAEVHSLRGRRELQAARDSLDTSLAVRTTELRRAKSELAVLAEDLQIKEEILARQAIELEESAVAMKVLLKNIATEDPGLDERVLNRKIQDMDEKIILNVKELTEPFLDKLARTRLDAEQQEYLSILRSNLEQVTSPVMQRLYSSDYGLTPSELQVANLVRQGKSSKNIAVALNLSVRTIEFHRDKIRKKLNIKERKTSLKAVLNSFRGWQ